MWTSSAVPSPDYTTRGDKVLLRHGIPDLTLLVHGRRLHVHSKILASSSASISSMLRHPDPIRGKEIHMLPPAGKHWTKAGVIALLDIAYPPHRLPPVQLLEEVEHLTTEYGMPALVKKVQLGIIKQGKLDSLMWADRNGIYTDMVFDAYAEFETEELKAMDGYSELTMATKLEIAQRRVSLLEAYFGSKLGEPYVVKHAHWFRKCPPELVPNASEDAHDLYDEETPEEEMTQNLPIVQLTDSLGASPSGAVSSSIVDFQTRSLVPRKKSTRSTNRSVSTGIHDWTTTESWDGSPSGRMEASWVSWASVTSDIDSSPASPGTGIKGSVSPVQTQESCIFSRSTNREIIGRALRRSSSTLRA